ncbi:hypothetical protein [Human papillomavirus 144]|uniref:E4 protein n=1 Tax=Human papillomavirus 144 TaxID=1070417 RepID=I3P6P9_9PAPI|nr:hypothetical protein [Human papillomavirus 144]AEM24660.1 hypothetical protein [Human papillomavirus 144]
MMACIMRNQMETECIFNCLTRMHKHMDSQDNGLLIIKIPLFLPLLLALQGQPPAHPRPASVGPPTPRPSRKFHPEDFKPRRLLVPRALLADDEENNKENLPFHQKEEEEAGLLDKALSQLLERWEEDIERLREQVSRELDDYKKKLGIRQ